MNITRRARVYGQAIYEISRAENLNGKATTVQRGARFVSMGVRLSDPRQIDKALRLAEPLAAATGTSVVIARRERGLILYQFQLDGAFWQDYTRADLETDIGVGLAEGRRQIDYSFKPPHTLVGGTTGSGKTETVRSMLAAIFETYSPDELQAIIIDLKGKFAEFANVSHLHGLDIARTDAEMNRALSIVNSQIKQREQTSDFSARRLLVVVDEAEAIFCTSARLAIGEALVKRGREVRAHGLFATQEPHKGQFGKRIFRLMQGRWIGLVDGPNTSYQICGRGGVGCHELTGQGDFVRLMPGNEYDRLQVALVTQADYDRLPRGNNGAPPQFEDVEPLDVDQLPEPEPETRGPGRPRQEVDPYMIGFYWAVGPNNVTKTMANEYLGLGYTVHKRHQVFAKRALYARKELLGKWRNARS